ncbi:MAG: hypothetical protein ACI8ZM_003661 [Crocinitomix sp.]
MLKAQRDYLVNKLNKKIMKIFIITLFSLISFFTTNGFGQGDRGDIIIQYFDADVELTVIGDGGDAVSNPQDLEFHPDLTRNELWVVMKGTEASGSSTVTFYDTGEDGQSTILKNDVNNWHFMSLTSGLAFSEDNYNWATSPNVWDANHDGGVAFTGPALWSSDMAIYGEWTPGNGSHLDMLHESSYCQGIAWETENVFWVYDGYIGDIVRYDFVDDHGAGESYHGDAKILRYGGLDLVKDPGGNVVSHMILDQATGWLYAVDNGNDRVIRLNINTGSIAGNPSYGPHEALAQYKNVDDFDWEEVITTGLESPSGIALINNKLLVADHATGDIIVYQTEGEYAFTEWFRIETDNPGIQGIEICPDGRIYYVNEITNKIIRLDAPTLSVKQEEKIEFNIYPNPSTGIINIVSSALPNGKIEIRNMIGELIYSSNYNGNNEIVDIETANGLYFVSVYDGESNLIGTEKVTINK